MTTNRRQNLLRQLTRLREIEHRQAAAAAGVALGEAQRHETLARRARALEAEAMDPARLAFAQDLAASLITSARVRGLAQASMRQAEAARGLADARLREEREARRKLDRLEDQRRAQASLDRRKADEPDHDQSRQRHLARIVNSPGTGNRERSCN